WREFTGDLLIRAHVRFLGEGVDPHRKAGVIIRAGLDADAPYVDAVVHGDGLTSMQYRRTKGADTEQTESEQTAVDVLQLERRGGRYIMSVARYGDPFTTVELTDLVLPDTVLVGIFLCSHNPEVVEQAVFENVRIVIPPPEGYTPYRDYIGSNLEIMDLATGHREIVFRHQESIQAPNWTLDGKSLIYNGDGRLYRFDIESRTPEEIYTGEVVRNNNDHVLTFDGTMLGISSTNPDLGGSSVYTVPVTGGDPVEITKQAPSYLHGWSPDAEWLVYTAERGDGNYDIYKIPSKGGEEVRLTTAEGLDDGPEFTPDGEWIYFNSTRSGLMQLWRMRPDGSDQQQVTDDEFNNWFPHISPDGKSIVFISYGQDVQPGDHPFYKHVYIRQMPIEGGEPRVIAYVFGGQGTINVPSYSPDGTRIAFVSNTDLP
ncbi:MAG TPA: biopolymer transporter TolR, partial [Rhodothermales bacterium]